MLGAILAALVPIVFVVALGWFTGARRLLPENAQQVLAGFVVTFALPIALFLAAAKAKPSDILDGPYVLALVVGLAGTYALAFGWAWISGDRRLDEDAMQSLTASFPNMAYCGPPVLLATVGEGALLAVVIGNLVTSILLVPLTLVLLERHRRAGGRGVEAPSEGFGRPLLAAVKKPLVFLPIAGVAIALAEIPLPALLTSTADEIGRAAGGVALFTLGLILSGIRLRLDRQIAVNVLIQNVVQPALILGVGLLVGLRGDPLKAVFLIGVLPSATENAMLALSHRVWDERAAASVMASTLFALVSISLGIVIAGTLP